MRARRGPGARAARRRVPRPGTVQSGPTLIEVLVAIAILGGTVGAVLVLMATQARGAAALADKAAARIVAENALVAVMVGAADGRTPSGTEAVAGREFAWNAAREASPLPGLDQVTVSVRREDGEQVLASLGTLVSVRERDR